MPEQTSATGATDWDTLPPDAQEQVRQGVAVLRQGGVVAFPTDTLYGLGVNIYDGKAVERVFEIKGRPYGMPLPVLLASSDDLEQVVSEVPEAARRLMEHFWPGPLTLVLPKAEAVPELITARGWKVGVRVPDHPVPRALARGLGAPVTGTSANRSGGAPTRTAVQVRQQLGDLVDLVIEAGPPPAGRESTVLDLTGPVPRMLRAGAISQEAIEQVLEVPLGT